MFPGGRPSVLRNASEQLRNWMGVVVGWGLMAGVAAFFLTERLPMFRRDVFSRIPLLGERYASYREINEDEDDNKD